MKISKRQLKRIIRENMAMRMTMDRMMQSDKDYSEPKYQSDSRKRKPSDPITKADVVKGSFKGTSSDRALLTKKLKDKIEKLIDQGYEKNVPSNWKDVLSHNDGDTLHALSKVVFPGFFGTLKRTLFPEGITTESQLRKIIRESILEEKFAGSRYQTGSGENLINRYRMAQNKIRSARIGTDDYDMLEDEIADLENQLNAAGYEINDFDDIYDVKTDKTVSKGSARL